MTDSSNCTIITHFYFNLLVTDCWPAEKETSENFSRVQQNVRVWHRAVVRSERLAGWGWWGKMAVYLVEIYEPRHNKVYKMWHAQIRLRPACARLRAACATAQSGQSRCWALYMGSQGPEFSLFRQRWIWQVCTDVQAELDTLVTL